MKTAEGLNIRCDESGKVCYTEREAGIVINSSKRHVYMGNHHWSKGRYSNSKDVPKRKYYCRDCGFYHVTHIALYDEYSMNRKWEEAFYKEFEEKKVRRIGA